MKYSQQTLKLADALTQLKNEFTYLQTDLEKYKGSSRPIEKVIFYKEQQIKSLTSIFNCFTEFKEQSDKLFSETEKTIAIKEDKNFKFEGICLLHGIRDFSYYLRLPTKKLAELLKDAMQNQWRQTPLELLPGYNKIEDLKPATQPTIDFTKLKEGAENNMSSGFQLLYQIQQTVNNLTKGSQN
ncbi:MAG: hypothetical protein H0U95_01105 [Bacteroidetes bacterium]|nr:hypothetical protein [Bacteroidota bacterium]